MDSSFWFNIAQNIVLLATLVAVFWQLRQVERATKRDALLRAVEDHDRLNELLLEHPKLNAFLGPFDAYTQWSTDEVDFMIFLTLALGRFERLHALHCEGYVEDELWNSWVKWVQEAWFSTELALRVWDKEGPFYSVRFQQFINALLSTRTSGCKSNEDLGKQTIEPAEGDPTH